MILNIRSRLIASLAGAVTLAQRQRSKPKHDFVFVLWKLDWVLYGICKDLAAELRKEGFSVTFSTWPGNVADGRVYFFSHHTLLSDRLLRLVLPSNSKKLVLFTHCQAKQKIYRLIDYLNQCDHIFAMNSGLCGQLIADGLIASKVSCELGFGNPELFFPEEEAERTHIGFVANFLADPHYRRRKNYEMLFRLVLHLSAHNKVLLIGKGFRLSEFSPLLETTKNFDYVEAEYSSFKMQYNRMKVFVSLSRLEGGPISLLEAMMCGCVPVATNTGFATDLIEHQVNGFIVQNYDNFGKFINLIERAKQVKDHLRVASSVADNTFQSFASRLVKKGLY
jgi:glycosyltransferase involved in cell wall biosynthesis